MYITSYDKMGDLGPKVPCHLHVRPIIFENFVSDTISVWHPNQNVSVDSEFRLDISELGFSQDTKIIYML